jgi:hypothetical protein
MEWLSGDYLLLYLVVILYVLLAALLVRQYLRTRNPGFLWLGAAEFLWPLARYPIKLAERSISSGKALHWFPATVVQHGDMTAGTFIISLTAFENAIAVVILLVAVFYLGRSSPSITAVSR